MTKVLLTQIVKLEIDDLLHDLQYEHDPEHVQVVSRPIRNLAHSMIGILQPSAELVAGLRLLVDARESFVRAALADKETDAGS